MNKNPQILFGLLLVGLGLLAFASGFLLETPINFGWPLLVALIGLAFFGLADGLASRSPWAALLYVPAALLTSMGAVLLINVLTGDWQAWAYAWMLVAAGLAGGLLLANRAGLWPRWIDRLFQGLIIAGVTGAVLFAGIARGRFLLVMAPLLLVFAGAAYAWLGPRGLLPGLARRSATSQPAALDQSALVEPLSSRELEVLVLIELGLANAEIADRLSVAPSTVKTHINNIYGKLGVENRVQALNRAKELGLIRSQVA